MRERILKTIKTVFELKEADESVSQMNCTEWDSLHHLNLVVELETEFAVTFEPEEINEMNDVLSIEKIISEKFDNN